MLGLCNYFSLAIEHGDFAVGFVFLRIMGPIHAAQNLNALSLFFFMLCFFKLCGRQLSVWQNLLNSFRNPS